MSRREKLIEMLRDEPLDDFLNYAVACEDIRDGLADQAIRRLRELNARSPDYVPAWFRLGQVLAEVGEVEVACDVLEKGIRIASRAGDTHAAGEMSEFRASLTAGGPAQQT